jgi:hypothetical protein
MAAGHGSAAAQGAEDHRPLACSVASDTLTAIRQLSCLPTCPQPFFGKPVSSTIQAIGLCRRVIAGNTCSRIRRTLPGARRAAIGSTLLRSSGSNSPFV